MYDERCRCKTSVKLDFHSNWQSTKVTVPQTGATLLARGMAAIEDYGFGLIEANGTSSFFFKLRQSNVVPFLQFLGFASFFPGGCDDVNFLLYGSVARALFPIPTTVGAPFLVMTGFKLNVSGGIFARSATWQLIRISFA